MKIKILFLFCIILYIQQGVCLGKAEQHYMGIGQVTVLSGQAVYLPFEAKVATCYIRPGQYVNKNQPLFSLDVLTLEKEEHELEVEYLELKQSLYELEKNNINISEGAINLSQALQETEHAKKRWKDSEKLLQAGIISQEEFLWDKRRYDQSVHHYKKQVAMQKHLNNQSINHEKRILLKKKIELSSGRLNLIHKFIKAPTILAKQGGLVLPVKLKPTEFYCQPGEKILSEQAIFWLAPVENMRVELKLDQVDLYQVKVGDKAKIIYMGHSPQEVDSEVLEIDAIPEQNIMPPKYKVFLKMQGGQNLRLGTQARVKIYFES